MQHNLNLLNLGIREDMETSLRQRIRITNGTAIFLAFFSILFIINEYYNTQNYLPPTIICLLYLAIMALNKAGLHQLSRFILSTLPGIIITLGHLDVLQAGDTPAPSLFFCQAAISFVPWLIYSFEERAKIFFLSVFNLSLLLTYKFGFGFSENKLDLIKFENGPIGYATIIGSFLTLCALFYLINKLHEYQLLENKKLLSKMQENHKSMEEKEQKLNAYIAQVKEKEKEDEQRSWRSEGMTQINQLIQNKPENIKDALIQLLSKHMNANQTALFELTIDEEHLEMTACYAYNRKKFLNQKFEVREGLTGQCYLEADMIYMDEVPADYVKITSGLGDSLPRMILLVPMIYQQKVVGVIEMASFQRLKAYQKEFMRAAAETIAAFLMGERVNVETLRLLQESQEQAEMLKSQEEEMRQNMEEMNAVQEEFSRKQIELERMIKERDQEIEKLQTVIQKNVQR